MASKLTDLELCKRIAEIEGLDENIQIALNKHKENRAHFERQNPSGVSNPFSNQKEIIDVYNPLTNNALLFDLIIKYRVEIEFAIDDECATVEAFPTNGNHHNMIEVKRHSGIPRAILETIIEGCG